MPSTDAPKKQRTDLRKHILHRFKSAVTRTRDAEVEGDELTADMSEEDMVAPGCCMPCTGYDNHQRNGMKSYENSYNTWVPPEQVMIQR
jgi:hypothetical protein